MNEIIATKTAGNYKVSIQKNESGFYTHSLFVESFDSKHSQEIIVSDDENESIVYTRGNLPQNVISTCQFMADVMRLIVIAEKWGMNFPITSPTITRRFSRRVRAFAIQNRLLTVTVQ